MSFDLVFYLVLEVLNQGNSRRVINIIVLYILNTIKLLTCNTRNLQISVRFYFFLGEYLIAKYPNSLEPI